jgi:hypothetical protein
MRSEAATPDSVVPSEHAPVGLHHGRKDSVFHGRNEGSRQRVPYGRETTRFLAASRNDTRFATHCNRIKPVLSTPDSRLPTPDFTP